jgi:hypothetical protein
LRDQLRDVVVGVVVDRLGELLELQFGPGPRLGLLARVGPRVGVVEVDPESETALRDPLRRGQGPFGPLVGHGVRIAGGLVPGLVEHAQARVLQAPVLHDVQQVRARTAVLGLRVHPVLAAARIVHPGQVRAQDDVVPQVVEDLQLADADRRPGRGRGEGDAHEPGAGLREQVHAARTRCRTGRPVRDAVPGLPVRGGLDDVLVDGARIGKDHVHLAEVVVGAAQVELQPLPRAFGRHPSGAGVLVDRQAGGVGAAGGGRLHPRLRG